MADPLAMARLVRQRDFWRADSHDLRFPKMYREEALRKVRALERQIEALGQGAN